MQDPIGAVRHIQTSVRHSFGVSPGSARLSHARSDTPPYGRSIERPYEEGERPMVTTSYRRPPVRLTRRGRVVVLAFFVLMASLASAILLATASRADDREAGPAPS